MIRGLYIDRQVIDLPETASIRQRIHAPVTIVDDPRQVYDLLTPASDPIARGKEILWLTRNRGVFLRDCPGTRDYRCCGYKTLYVGTFCTMDCAYCILQAYFHPPVLRYFVNREALAAELADQFARPEIARIGSGEFTDSLIWEQWTDLVPDLVNQFAGQDRAVLELKTKTVHIERLGRLDHGRRTILAWSLNPPEIIAAEERGAASLAARLRAAEQAQTWRYPLAFHFDPVIDFPGAGAAYARVAAELFRRIRPESIAWISIGALRFMPALKQVIHHRFPDSAIASGEMIPGLDNKWRYVKPVRIALYRHLVNAIREYAPDVFVYFCMEDDDVWHRVMGHALGDDDRLSALLDDQARKVCGVTAG